MHARWVDSTLILCYMYLGGFSYIGAYIGTRYPYSSMAVVGMPTRAGRSQLPEKPQESPCTFTVCPHYHMHTVSTGGMVELVLWWTGGCASHVRCKIPLSAAAPVSPHPQYSRRNIEKLFPAKPRDFGIPLWSSAERVLV